MEKNLTKYLKTIDKIEKTRTRNNVNWMDILRIAMKENPKKTKKVRVKLTA